MKGGDPIRRSPFPSEGDCSAKAGERKKRAPAWVSRRGPLPLTPSPKGRGQNARIPYVFPASARRLPQERPPSPPGRGLGGGATGAASPAPSMRRVRRGRTLKIISFFTVNFLDTASRTPYIGPVNARSAPAAASRRPRKKRTKKRAGTFPLSGPPPPIGHPIRHPMRHPVRRPLRRRGLTAGPRPVRPSASAGPCCPAMPPPVLSGVSARPGGWKISYRDCFCALPKGVFPAIPKG